MYNSFDDAVHALASEVANLVISKQKDYGPRNILNCPVGAENGIIVRLYDKLARVSHLIEKGKIPQNEALEDTWKDIIGYGLVALMVRRNVFELPLKEDE